MKRFSCGVFRSLRSVLISVLCAAMMVCHMQTWVMAEENNNSGEVVERGRNFTTFNNGDEWRIT